MAAKTPRVPITTISSISRQFRRFYRSKYAMRLSRVTVWPSLLGQDTTAASKSRTSSSCFRNMPLSSIQRCVRSKISRV